jgi:hypothetical protein
MMKFDLTKLYEADAFVEIPFGNQEGVLKVRRHLSSGEISWLSAEYVQNYFNGLELNKGEFLTEQIGNNLFNPQLARRQFLIDLTGLVTDLEIDVDTINAFEKHGLFELIEDEVCNVYDVIRNAERVIKLETSTGVVVQGFINRIISLIPEGNKLETLTKDLADVVNKIEPERLAFIGEMLKSDKDKI